MTVLVIGSVNADLTVRADHIPAPGETVLGTDAVTSPGGKGANQAVATALAGAPVALIGAVGRDAFAPTARRGLERAGVGLTGLHVLDVPTGLALITVARSGENAITVASGANAHLNATHLPQDLSGVTHLLLQQELSAALTLAAARQASAAGVPVFLNAAPARPADPQLLSLVTHLILNEQELAGLSPGEPEQAARALLDQGPRAVTVTLGERGSLTVTPGATHRLSAHPVTAADTTGAGDTFCGVLAARLALGDDLPAALRAAGVAAALTCTRPGAQDAMPDWHAVAAALAPAS